MEKGSLEWTEQYRPTRLREVVGNEQAIEELREWADGINRPKSKKAAVLHGPAGCGKTSAAYALASEKGWEVIELNASDKRSAGVIKDIVGPASTSTTFSHTTRLIILDEADNLHGNEDRGGTRAITEIVKKSTQPIILTANDKYGMGQGLLRTCTVIAFHRIKPGTVFRLLKKISEQAALDIEDGALISLAKNAHGDLRSAINDLQALSLAGSGMQRIREEDIATDDRDREEDIFGVLKLIYGVERYELQEALSALYSLDKTPEESIQWVYKNFSYEYDDESFMHGLRYLSRADMFLGRVRRRENYKFWRYASSLMAGSVLSAKELHAEKKNGWERRKPRYFQSPWFRAKLPEGEARKSGPVQDELARKIARYSKVPQSYALFFIVPFLPVFFKDGRKATEITASLHLDVPQIAFLLGDTGKENAKQIYQNALTATATERGTERVTRIERTVKADVNEADEAEEKHPKTRESELEEKSAVADEVETKNQKTLTDFF
ncbi:MAG: replication factor C large subunit [Methanomicrobia archaeon]|nr:replication factor C large subunit [Methanomicrobia archaeon]